MFSRKLRHGLLFEAQLGDLVADGQHLPPGFVLDEPPSLLAKGRLHASRKLVPELDRVLVRVEAAAPGGRSRAP
jgi:hypothetical protein